MNMVLSFDANSDGQVTFAEFLEKFTKHALQHSNIQLKAGTPLKLVLDSLQHNIGQVILSDVAKVLPTLNADLVGSPVK